MNRKDCETSNWQDVGFEDGQNGYSLDYLERRKRSCSKFDVKINRDAYLAGREDGIRGHCSVAHFYFAGEMGFSAQPSVCPDDTRGALSQAYQEGGKLFLLRRKRDAINKDIQQFREDRSALADVTRISSAIRGVSATEKEESQLAEVESQIQKMQSEAPDTAEYCEFEMKRKTAVKSAIPGFLLGASPDAQFALSGCSRSSPMINR